MGKKKTVCPNCGALTAGSEALCPACAGAEGGFEAFDAPTPVLGGKSPPRRFGSSRRGRPLPPDMPRGFAGHKLLREIGRGGTAVVYLAREPEWGREVALKVALPELDPRLQQRFLSEAHVTGRLQHPAVVPVYRVGRLEDGRDYYTMKRVQGRTLSEIIRSLRAGNEGDVETYNLRRRATVMLAVCEGVAFAHDHGVIHRDLKPGNIMVGDYGEVYILDWGLAKMLFGGPEATLPGGAAVTAGGEGEISAAGSPVGSPATDDEPRDASGRALVSGTPAYMSPEQARGETKKIGRHSDIWSLGAVFFQLLTLHAPVRGGSPEETLRNVVAGKRLRMADIPEGRAVPGELAEIVERALQPDPAARYEDVHGFAADLRAFMEGQGRWREVYRIRFDDPERWRREWKVLLGEWVVDEHGLHPENPKKNTAGATILLDRPFSGDVRLELKGRCREGTEDIGELSVFLSAPEPGRGKTATDGYCFQFGADWNSSAKLAKNNVDVAVRTGVRWRPDLVHRVTAERIGDRLRMEVDGRELFSFVDLFPLPGDHVGIYGFGPGGYIEELRVFSRGLDAAVSCLAVPDHDFNRGRYEEALEGYHCIAGELWGREEGRLAQYKAGLACLAMERPEEARKEFERLDGTPGEMLAHLGRALLCEREDDWRKELERLEHAARLGRGSPLQAYVLAHLWMRATAIHRARQQEAAVAFYQTILRADPHGGRRVAQALRHICQDLLDLGRDEEALRHLEQLGLESPRERPEVLSEALRYLLQRGRWDDAMAAALALKETASSRAEAYSYLARSFIYRRVWDVAERYVDDGLAETKAEKPSLELLRLRLWLTVLRGRPDLAEKMPDAPPFTKIPVTDFPAAAELLFWRVWTAVLNGKRKKADELLRAASAARSRPIIRGTALHLLSRRAALRGNVKEARRYLERARRLKGFTPRDYPVDMRFPFMDHLHVGEAFLRAAGGDKGGARASLEALTRDFGRLPGRFLDRTAARVMLQWDGATSPPEPPPPGLDCPGYLRADYFLLMGEWAEVHGRKATAVEAFRRVVEEALAPHDFPAWVAVGRLKALGEKPPLDMPEFPPL